MIGIFKRLPGFKRAFLNIVLLIVAFWFLFDFLIGPVLIKLRKLDNEIDNKAFLLKEYFYLESRGQDLFLLYENYNGSLKDASLEETTGGFFEEIERLAAEFGLEVKRLKPLSSGEHSGYRQIFLEAQLEADFVCLFRFINYFDNYSGLSKVYSFQVQPQPGSFGKVNCILVFSRPFFGNT